MNNTTPAGVAEARRANALALGLQLGIPAGRPGASGVTFAAIQKLTSEILEGMNQKARLDCCDIVAAVYGNEIATTPAWYILVLRGMFANEVLKVNPAVPADDGNLVLVSQCSTRQFAVDERGLLRESKAAAKVRRERSQRQARDAIGSTAASLGALLQAGCWEEATYALNDDGRVTEVKPAAA